MPERSHRSAYLWAIRALGRRMHSESEIRSGLIKRGFEDNIVSDVVGELIEKAYLDDSVFTSQWIRARSENRGYGRIRIYHELRQKGIDTELAQSAMDVCLPPERECDIARQAADRRLKKIRKEGIRKKAALFRYLESRGFTSQAIWSAIKDIGFEEEKV
ncbi:MAG: regulatory protein RecX [bacterium]